MFGCQNHHANFFARKTSLQPQTEAELIQQMSAYELSCTIRKSSYYHKHCPAQAIDQLSRPELEQLYNRCRSYACSSIINSLYRVDQLKPEVNHLYCKRSKFRILARTRTNWEVDSMEETANQRNFLSFSILENRNLSHFPGRILYGYRSHLTSDLIAHISHIDANTSAYAENRLQLTEDFEELLDINDLLDRTLQAQTYCQISIATKYPDPANPGTLCTFLPDCIICIGKPDRTSREVAQLTGLPILMIHPADDTIYHVHDFYSTPNLANPQFI